MDSQLYSQLVNFLTNIILPNNLTKQEKDAIKRKSRYFILINKQLFKKNKNKQQPPLKVLQKNEINEILYYLHEDDLAGHFNIEETFRKVKNRYYWPQMYEDVRNYVKSCDQCQKRGKNKRTEPLHTITVEQPFDRIGLDFVGPLPVTSRGNKYIIVAMDYLTKWPEAKAMPNAKASSAANFFYEEIVCRHGCPKVLLTDRGTHFVNELLDSLCKKLGVKHILSSAYHPQTNGLVERFNRTLCEALAKYANTKKNDWDLYIPSVLFAYRNMKHNTTKYEPFQLTYGRKAKLPIDYDNYSPDNNEITCLLERTNQLINNLKRDRFKAQDNIYISQQKQAQYHDKKIKPVDYKIGNQVLLYKSHLHNKKKLEERWKGPYYIHDKIGNGVYKLRTIDGKVLKTPINSERIKLYNQRN